MSPRITAVCLFFALAAAALSSMPGRTVADAPAPVRIGVYDNRAIAVAALASKHNPVSAKMAEYRQAREDHDRKKMKELKQWGEDHQRLAHFQGFCHVPVGELFEPVQTGLAAVAARHNLVAITRACDHVAPGVETVDVTDDLVALFDPTEKTLKRVAEIRKAKPLPLTTIADVKHSH